jgi:hypothetical protein
MAKTYIMWLGMSSVMTPFIFSNRDFSMSYGRFKSKNLPFRFRSRPSCIGRFATPLIGP